MKPEKDKASNRPPRQSEGWGVADAEQLWQEWLDGHRDPSIPEGLCERINDLVTQDDGGPPTERSPVAAEPASTVTLRSRIALVATETIAGRIVVGVSALVVGAIPYLYLLTTWKLF